LTIGTFYSTYLTLPCGAITKKTPKMAKRIGKVNRHKGSSIDNFLREEGVFEEFQARAVKEVIAWQLAQAMKEQKLSKRRLAALMHTSRTQLDRVLDPSNGNVTIETLQRAAAILGRKVQVELV
jgi:antitoxin HicB